MLPTCYWSPWAEARLLAGSAEASQSDWVMALLPCHLPVPHFLLGSPFLLPGHLERILSKLKGLGLLCSYKFTPLTQMPALPAACPKAESQGNSGLRGQDLPGQFPCSTSVQTLCAVGRFQHGPRYSPRAS